MRALHLIGLRTASGDGLRYRPTDDAPLVLPSWLRKSDREILLAFYQQLLSDDLLPRIEVDWHRSLGNANRSFLRNLRDRHGGAEHFLVVKVRRAGTDLVEVQSEAVIQSFQHVAIACSKPTEGETFGRLNALVQLVTETAQETYDSLAAELSLRDDGPALLEPLVRTLLNPTVVAESYNALIDVQAEGVAPDKQRDAVLRRVLGKLLERLPEEELATLAAVIVKGASVAETLSPQSPQAIEALRHRMLLRDGTPTRWARLLCDEGLHDVVRDQLRRTVTPAPKDHSVTRKVLGWFEASTVSAPASAVGGEALTRALSHEQIELARASVQATTNSLIRQRIDLALNLIDVGQLGQARDELTAIELAAAIVDDETRGFLCFALGMLHRVEGRIAEARECLQEALRRTPAFSSLRIYPVVSLALRLRDDGDWAEAEHLFLEALNVLRNYSALQRFRVATLREYAAGLRQNGLTDEAEARDYEAAELERTLQAPISGS